MMVEVTPMGDAADGVSEEDDAGAGVVRRAQT
jgi:hypothetical protein